MCIEDRLMRCGIWKNQQGNDGNAPCIAREGFQLCQAKERFLDVLHFLTIKKHKIVRTARHMLNLAAVVPYWQQKYRNITLDIFCIQKPNCHSPRKRFGY
jgi:hypothetical protein